MFEELINTNDEQTELKCAKYLHYAVGLLIPQTPVRVSVGREDRNYFGSTDFVVSATLLNDRSMEEDYAYVWELKAPQCFLFEPDENKNRYRPTKEFLKAENQMLHYFLLAEGDQAFRQRFGIMNHKNIKLGGIIIGRSHDRMYSGESGIESARKAEVAVQVRSQYLYAFTGIRVLTWDRVLKHLLP